MFYSSFLGCLEKFSYLYRTFPPEKKLPENLVVTVKVPTFALAFGKDARRDVPERGRKEFIESFT